MESNDRFFDVKFHELDVLLLLKDINPSKTAVPDGIHGMIIPTARKSRTHEPGS